MGADDYIMAKPFIGVLYIQCIMMQQHGIILENIIPFISEIKMQLLEFIQRHVLLASLFAVFLLAVIIFEIRARLRAGVKLSPQAVIAMVNRENAVLLDIRAADKFKNGHIINAKHTPQDKAEDLLKQLKIAEDKPIIMVCQRGISAALVGERLKKQGFTRIYVLQGGMDAWLQAQLPVEK